MHSCSSLGECDSCLRGEIHFYSEPIRFTVWWNMSKCFYLKLSCKSVTKLSVNMWLWSWLFCVLSRVFEHVLPCGWLLKVPEEAIGEESVGDFCVFIYMYQIVKFILLYVLNCLLYINWAEDGILVKNLLANNGLALSQLRLCKSAFVIGWSCVTWGIMPNGIYIIRK